jgi:hypothetical protein
VLRSLCVCVYVCVCVCVLRVSLCLCACFYFFLSTCLYLPVSKHPHSQNHQTVGVVLEKGVILAVRRENLEVVTAEQKESAKQEVIPLHRVATTRTPHLHFANTTSTSYQLHTYIAPTLH